jgi:ABC-2 type transport system permease protein
VTTTAEAGTPVARPAAVARPVPVARAYRFELIKLLSQWRVRLLIVACWLAPALFVAVISQQASLPVDTLFGRWMHATGWAGVSGSRVRGRCLC